MINPCLFIKVIFLYTFTHIAFSKTHDTKNSYINAPVNELGVKVFASSGLVSPVLKTDQFFCSFHLGTAPHSLLCLVPFSSQIFTPLSLLALTVMDKNRSCFYIPATVITCSCEYCMVLWEGRLFKANVF